MYAGLPLMNTDAVASLAVRAFAIPKSEIRTAPSHDSSTLCGDTSRCTTPRTSVPVGRSCACPSPRSSSPITKITTGIGSRPDDASASRSLPSTSSITRNSRPSASRSKSSTDTMFGCTSCELIRASVTNIRVNAGFSENPGSTRLIATRRENPSAPTAEPLNTSAMPPPPSRWSSRYLPVTPSIVRVLSISAAGTRARR